MASGGNWTKSLFTGLWTVLTLVANWFLTLFLFCLLSLFCCRQKWQQGNSPSQTVFYLKLNGQLVIEETQVDPFDKFMQEALDQQDDNPEILIEIYLCVGKCSPRQ